MSNKSRREIIRKSLLRHIDPDMAVSDDVRTRIAELTDHDLMPSHRFESIAESIPFGELEYLRMQGVDVEREDNVHLRDTRDSIAPFITTFRSNAPQKSDVVKLVPLLRKLYLAVRQSNVSKEQAMFGWDTLAEACRIIVQVKGLPKSVVLFTCGVISSILTSTKDDTDLNYDEHGGWGGPAPHVSAAASAMFLFPEYASESALQLVRLAAIDEFKPARTQVALFLLRLSVSHSDAMWEIAELLGQHDQSSRVVQAFVAQSLPRLFFIDESRADLLLKATYSRLEGAGESWGTVRNACQSIYLWRSLLGSSGAEAVINNVLDHRFTSPADIKSILFDLRSHVRRSDPAKPEYPNRAYALLARIASLFAKDYSQFDRSLTNGAMSDEEWSLFNATSQNLLELASEIFFASNAFNRTLNPKAEPTESDLRFIDHALPAIDAMTSVTIPGVIHKLLETLDYFVDRRAEALYSRISLLILAGSRGAYNFEPLGADLAVKILEKYMSEYRSIIEKSTENRKNFISCLDVFAAWPKAVRLVYRFEETFR